MYEVASTALIDRFHDDEEVPPSDIFNLDAMEEEEIVNGSVILNTEGESENDYEGIEKDGEYIKGCF